MRLQNLCNCCGDLGGFPDPVKRDGWVCKDCYLELTLGVIPPMEKITGRCPHKPHGVTITTLQRPPGTGDGNDYFGNHT